MGENEHAKRKDDIERKLGKKKSSLRCRSCNLDFLAQDLQPESTPQVALCKKPTTVPPVN